MRRSAFFFGGARRLRRPHARSFSDIRTPSGKSALRRPFSFLTNAVPLPAAPGVPATLCRLRALVPRLMRTAPCCVRCAFLWAGVSAAVSPFSGVVRARLAGARLFLGRAAGLAGAFLSLESGEEGRGRRRECFAFRATHQVRALSAFRSSAFGVSADGGGCSGIC